MQWMCENCCSEWADKMAYNYWWSKQPTPLCQDCYDCWEQDKEYEEENILSTNR